MCKSTTDHDTRQDEIYDAIIDLVDQQAMPICRETNCRLLIVDYVDGYPVPACYATKKRNGIGYTYHYFDKQKDCPRLRQYPRMCQSCKEYECPKTINEIVECKNNER